MKRKRTICFVVMLFMLLSICSAYATEADLTQSETVEKLRTSESLILVEVLSQEIDDDNRSSIEGQGELCKVKLRFVKTIFSKEKPTGIYTLRGYFDGHSVGKKLIVDVREPTLKEKSARKIKLDSESMVYDAGKYVIGLIKIPLVTAKCDSKDNYYSWLESNLISEKTLIGMLNGSVETNDFYDYTFPSQYDAIFDGRVWKEGDVNGELAFIRITKSTYIRAEADKTSQKILALKPNDRIVIYREQFIDANNVQWSKVLYGNGERGYIVEDNFTYTTPGTKPYSIKEIKLAKVMKTGNMYDANYVKLLGATIRKGTSVVIGEQVTHAGNKYYRILGGPQAIAYIPAECVTVIHNIKLGTSTLNVNWIYEVDE